MRIARLGVVVLVGLVAATAGAKAQDLRTLTQDDVRALQRRLVDAGCYTGALDGNPSAALAEALKTCPSQEPVLSIETGMHTAMINRIGGDNACRMVATASDDKTVRIWSVPDGRLIRTQRLPISEGNMGKVYAVAVSPDGKRIAAGGWDGIRKTGKAHGIYLFDTGGGTQIRHLGAFEDVVLHLAFSHDGKRIAASLGSQGIRVLDAETGNELMADREFRDASYGISFGTDGSLYAVGDDGFLRQYGPNLRRKARVTTPGGKRPFSVAVDPRGELIAVSYDDSTAVDFFNSVTLKHISPADTSGAEAARNDDFSKLTWSADGQYLYGAGKYRVFLTGSWKRVVRKWTRDGKREGEDAPIAGNTVMSLMPCADGIAFASQDPSFGLVRADASVEVLGRSNVPDMRAKVAGAFTVSADGTRVRFGLVYGDRQPVLFDIASGLSDSPAAPSDLNPPNLTGLRVTDWENADEPKLNGKGLALRPYEMSRSLAIREDRKGMLLGTEFSLRSYAADGSERWRRAAPSIAWGVNLASAGEVAIVAYGDGTVRWHRWEDGRELLALFVNRDDKRWVAWTPTGYYMASPGAEDLIGWHVNRGWEQPADFFPVARFRDRFNRPDIVRAVLETLDENEAIKRANTTSRRAEQSRPVSSQLPPVIRVTNFDEGGRHAFANEALTLEYELRSPSGQAITRIEFLIDGRPQQAFALGTRTGNPTQARTGMLSVVVPKRDVDIAVIAWSEDLASEPARLRLNWTGPREEDRLKPKLYALVIGVSDYADRDLKLNFAAKDATDFARVLQAQAGGMYSTVNINLMTDAKVTRNAIVEGLAWLEQQVTSRDIGIVFLAGHGVNDEKLNYWFLPADANVARLRTHGVVQDDIRRTLRNLSGKAILFLDTCHSGQLMKVAALTRGQADQTAMINDFIKAENGVIVFASSQGKEVSVELPDLKNGAFTKALIEGIGEGQANLLKKGHITPAQLDAFVVERVKELTSGQQHPVMSKPDTVPDFPFAIVKQ